MSVFRRKIAASKFMKFFIERLRFAIAGLLLAAAIFLQICFTLPLEATADSNMPLQKKGESSANTSQIDLAQKTDQKSRRPKYKVRKSKAAALKANIGSPSPTQRHLTIGIFSNLIILGIYVFWVKVRDENAGPTVYAAEPSHGRNGLDLRPVKLDKIQGIDPFTRREDGSSMIQPIGKFRGNAVADQMIEADPDQEDISEEDTVAFCGDEVASGISSSSSSTKNKSSTKPQFPEAPQVSEATDPILTSSAFRIKDLKNGADVMRKPSGPSGKVAASAALFPPEIGIHYQAKAGEKLALTCDFNAPLYSAGTLVITNMRLLAVYQRHVFKLFLPQATIENRRNSVRLRQIEEVSITGSNRPLLLAIGAVSAWIPVVGVVIAGICVTGFFFLTRPELAVRMDNHTFRTYPLRAEDMGRALHLIDRARHQLATKQPKKLKNLQNQSQQALQTPKAPKAS